MLNNTTFGVPCKTPENILPVELWNYWVWRETPKDKPVVCGRWSSKIPVNRNDSRIIWHGYSCVEASGIKLAIETEMKLAKKFRKGTEQPDSEPKKKGRSKKKKIQENKNQISLL